MKDCATAAGVLTTVLKAEAREAQRELEPAEPPAGVNGHGPDAGRDHDGALTTHGTRELPAQNVAFGAPLQMSEHKVQFREGDK